MTSVWWRVARLVWVHESHDFALCVSGFMAYLALFVIRDAWREQLGERWFGL